MGLEIKRNKKGLYLMVSTVSNGRIHEEPSITEDEAKKVLIKRLYFDFMQKAIEVGMTFPNGYQVNDVREYHENLSEPYYAWTSAAFKSEDYFKTFTDKFNEIKEKLNLEL